MSQYTRGSEATVQIIVDGDLKNGSFAKVKEWSFTPRQTVEEVEIMGELEDDLDFMHKGFDFDLNFYEIDHKLREVLLLFVTREQARAAYPDVQIVLTIKHRAGNDATETLIWENCIFKFDKIGAGSKKEMIATNVTGKFKTITQQ